MKSYLLAAGAALLLVACHKTPDTTAAASDTAAAASDTVAASSAAVDAAAAPAPPAADFVAKAAASDMYETAASKIAEKRAKSAEVKAFAKMMVADHAKSTAAIKKAVADSGRTDITPPAALPADKQALIDALNGASDADFDKTYVDQQVQAHKDALALMSSYASGGDVAQLKDAAAMIVPTVQTHLDHITAIQSGLAK